MKTQSISFGKTPVMTCTIKSADKKEQNSATLYQMDTKEYSDLKEILYSKNARCLIRDFEEDAGRYTPYSEYYLLKNDKTQEVIACAQTSRHYRTGDAKSTGFSTLIEEMSQNSKYVNGAEPILAFIAHKAEGRFDNCVTTAFDRDVIPTLKNSKFTQLRTGDWYLPEKRYPILIDQAEKRANISFLV